MHKTLRGRAAKRERKREEKQRRRPFLSPILGLPRLPPPSFHPSRGPKPAHKGRVEWKLAFLEEMVSPGGAMRSLSLSLSLRHGETCRIKRATSVEKFTPPLCVYAIFLAPPRLTFPLTKRSSFVPSLVFPSASLPGKENGCCANVRDVLHSIPLSLKAAW